MVSFADISHHNSANLTAYKNAGHDRIAIKVTESNNFIDPEFKNRWVKSRQLGLKRIGYHFLRNDIPGAMQADFFLKSIKSDLILATDTYCVDTEDTDTPSKARTCTTAFVNRMVQLGHTKGLVYSGKWYLDPHKITADSVATGWRNLWISDYSGPLEMPIGWNNSNIVAHQYSDKVPVVGLGSVDYSKVIKEWIGDEDMAGATPEEVEKLFQKYITARQTSPDKPVPVGNLADVLVRFGMLIANGAENATFLPWDRKAPALSASDQATLTYKPYLKDIQAQVNSIKAQLETVQTSIQSILASLKSGGVPTVNSGPTNIVIEGTIQKASE